MTKTYIDHQGKKYPIQELTIKMWGDIMKYKNILDDVELYVKMISEMTGMSDEEVKEADADTIIETGKDLFKYINQESRQVFYTIKHKDTEYDLCDFSNMSFGQFVDIDTFMSKDEAYRISNLNELAAYLYTEKGKKYGEADFKKNIEKFKQLPMKYIEGAVFFLWTLERGLLGLSQLYSKNKWLTRGLKVIIVLASFGATISGYLNSRRTKFGKLLVLLVSPLFFVSTIFRTFLTYVRNKTKRLKNK
jgi:hypothetical protein